MMLHYNVMNAIEVSRGNTCSIEALHLVGSGALPGAGKTLLGELLPKCLERVLGQRVIRRYVSLPTVASLKRTLINLPGLSHWKDIPARIWTLTRWPELPPACSSNRPATCICTRTI